MHQLSNIEEGGFIDHIRPKIERGNAEDDTLQNNRELAGIKISEYHRLSHAKWTASRGSGAMSGNCKSLEPFSQTHLEDQAMAANLP